VHHGRHQDSARDIGVDEDGRGEAEPYLLACDRAPVDERREHQDHDQRGGGDDPPGLGLAPDHRALVVAGERPLFAHSADEEDLVVGGQAEQDGEHQRRDPRLDRRCRAESEQRLAPAELERGGHHAQRDPERQQVQDRCRQRDEQAAEHDGEQQEGQSDDHGQEQRQLGAQYLGEVRVFGRAAADVDGQRAAGLRPGNVGPQPVQQGGGGGVLRSCGREHLGDLGLAVRAELRRGDRGNAGQTAGSGSERGEACLVRWIADLPDQVQGPVEARAEPLRQQLVGLVGGR